MHHKCFSNVLTIPPLKNDDVIYGWPPLENLNNGVLRKMDLSKDIYGEIEFIAAKCVFVKASANNIYVTDLGNGFVLDTDTQFWKTR